MKIGDVYNEKHTVVGISKRTGTVSETDTEIVEVIPIEVLDKIKAEIEQIAYPSKAIYRILGIIDKHKTESGDNTRPY